MYSDTLTLINEFLCFPKTEMHLVLENTMLYALLWMKYFTVYAQHILRISLKTRFLVPEIEVTSETEYDFSQVPHHWNIFLLNLSRPIKRYFRHRQTLQPELPLFSYRVYGTRGSRISDPTEWLHTHIWRIIKHTTLRPLFSWEGFFIYCVTRLMGRLV